MLTIPPGLDDALRARGCLSAAWVPLQVLLIVVGGKSIMPLAGLVKNGVLHA